MESPNSKPAVLIVVPAYNEEEPLPRLTERLVRTLTENNIQGQIRIVDDGSTDKTGKIADELKQTYDFVSVVHHPGNLGKSAALTTGFENDYGDIVVFIDADLQYAPEDLPKLLRVLNQGYDVVNGWRKRRRDPLSKKIPSKLYNFIARKMLDVNVHDFNCGFKVFKREVLEKIRLRKGFHRYMLAMARNHGYKIAEVEIQHFPREYGKSKYSVRRLLLGLMDLIALKLQLSLMEQPMTFFGLLGIALILLGFLSGGYLIFLQVAYGIPLHTRPLLLLSVLLVIAGIQSFSFGFLAEAIIALREEIRHIATGHKGRKGRRTVD